MNIGDTIIEMEQKLNLKLRRRRIMRVAEQMIQQIIQYFMILTVFSFQTQFVSYIQVDTPTKTLNRNQ